MCSSVVLLIVEAMSPSASSSWSLSLLWIARLESMVERHCPFCFFKKLKSECRSRGFFTRHDERQKGNYYCQTIKTWKMRSSTFREKLENLPWKNGFKRPSRPLGLKWILVGRVSVSVEFAESAFGGRSLIDPKHTPIIIFHLHTDDDDDSINQQSLNSLPTLLHSWYVALRPIIDSCFIDLCVLSSDVITLLDSNNFNRNSHKLSTILHNQPN